MVPIRLPNRRVEVIENWTQVQPSNPLRGSISDLSFESVAPKFRMPIAKAAKELKVGEITLALWCRMSVIPRWPYRKLKSIDSLITTIQKYGSDQHLGDKGVECTIKMLEEEKISIMKAPSLSLQTSTLVLIKKMQNLAYTKRRKVKKEENERPDVSKIHEMLEQAPTPQIMKEVEKQKEMESAQPTQQGLNVQKDLQRGKLRDLSFELVAPKFEMPIQQAAKQLGINKSTLQQWCKVSGIPRWPYRKLQSMEALLTNVQEFGSDGLFGEEGLVAIMQKLKEEKRAIKESPWMAINENTISLMRYMTHKAWKKRKLMKDKEACKGTDAPSDEPTLLHTEN